MTPSAEALYYIRKGSLTACCYPCEMSTQKQLVSFRLSEHMLRDLDALSAKLGFTRSQSIETAILLLLNTTSGAAETRYEPKAKKSK